MALAAGVLSIGLPWIDGPGGLRSGLGQPDGRLALAAGVVALVLAWYRVRVGWIVPGFVSVLLLRDVVLLLGHESARPGVGLWVSALGFVAGTVVQLVDLVRTRLR